MSRVKVCGVGLALSLFALGACQDAKSGGDAQPVDGAQRDPAAQCSADVAAECAALQSQISELDQRRKKALDDGDAAATSRLTLELNHKAELLAMLEDGETTPAARASIESKYAALAKLLEADLVARGGGGGTGGRGGSTDDGLVRRIPLSPLAYHPLEHAAVQKVVRDFGELYVPVTDEPTVEEVRIAMPWSGYWYPSLGDELFHDDQSPLAKLDRLAQQRGLDVRSAELERSRHDRVGTDSWEGLCGAWAIASATTLEPKRDVEIDGVVFTIQDQKGLLTKAHDNATFATYGVLYDASFETDGTIQDLRPEAFHRMAEVLIGKQQRSFVIDTDPGYQVWSKPLYRVRWSMRKDPEVANAVLVDASPFATKERNVETADPTSPQTETYAPLSYKYRLYYDAATQRDGRFRVVAGEWLGKGRREHPDFAMVPIESGNWRSGNEELNKAMDLIKEIVAAGRQDP